MAGQLSSNKVIFLAAALLVGVGRASASDIQSSPVFVHCQTCHGINGDSTKPNVPRLNGQHAEYLKARLESFRDPGSQDPHAIDAMWGEVLKVDDATLAAIADYLSAQTPMPASSSSGPLADEGRKLYETGDSTVLVPACQSCHGPHGEGSGAVPRLAGQHAVYLTNQLERLRLGLRWSDTMHPKTNSLSDRQIRALVAYLANN